MSARIIKFEPARPATRDEAKTERMRFLQGMFLGTSLALCGHNRNEILGRIETLSAAWEIGREDFEESFDEMLEQVDAAERSQLMN